MLARSKRISSAAAAAALCAAAFSVPAHAAATRPDPAAVPLAQAGPAVSVNLTQAIALARLTARAARYRVRPGDTLSSIAARYYQRSSDWPVLYWGNHLRWADDITAGQTLAIPAEPATVPAVPAGLLEPPAPRPVTVLAAYSPAPVTAGPAQAPVSAQAAVVSYGGGVPASFQACVIARESAGNARAVNPSSGAGGLYGFLPSTWASLGYSGLPEDAPVAVQDAAFAKEYAEAGTSPWQPSDDC